MKELRDLTKNINYCNHCGTPVPSVSKEIKESSASVRILLEREVGAVIVDEKTGEATESKKKLREYLSPRKCYNILRNISDTDCYLLGFNPTVSRQKILYVCVFQYLL